MLGFQSPVRGLQLSKFELDAACNDDRFTDDFFVDLVFEEALAGAFADSCLGPGMPGGPSVGAEKRRLNRGRREGSPAPASRSIPVHATAHALPRDVEG